MDICICMTDSLCYTPETNTLSVNSTPIKLKTKQNQCPGSTCGNSDFIDREGSVGGLFSLKSSPWVAAEDQLHLDQQMQLKAAFLCLLCLHHLLLLASFLSPMLLTLV